MGGFVWNGFDAYLGEGIPWLFQQGMFCSTFYHFYAHDKEGFIGVTLRNYLKPIAVTVMAVLDADETEILDDALFAKFAVGVFMVVVGILRMPQFLGPRFSPFTAIGSMAGKLTGSKKKKDLKPSKKSKKKTQ